MSDFTSPTPGPEVADGTALRRRLRAATRPAHERLHHHPGLAAAAAGTITRPGYRRLLLRLLGFHRPLAAAAGEGAARVRLLAEDLRALGVGRPGLAGVALCPFIPRLATAERRLGARYVVAGAALGGAVIAAGLDPLLGPGVVAGRRFFLSEDGAAAWRAVLAELAAAPAGPQAAAHAAIVGAAEETFQALEAWLGGWNGAPHDRP